MDIALFFDWQILLLITPCVVGIAIFSYLTWSDERYYKKKEKELREQIINKNGVWKV